MRTVQTQNFVKILRAVFEIWTKNIKNAPKMGVFPHLRPPKIFFQKSGSVTFVPLWCSNCSDSYLLLNSYIANTRIHRVDAFLLTQIAYLRLHSYYGSIAFVTCIKISTFMHLLLQQFTNIRSPWSAQNLHKDTNSGTENGTEHTCLSITNIFTYLCFTI